jgi:stage V sporulation protein AD
MTNKKRGKQTICFAEPPLLKSWATIVGPKEAQSPWNTFFDKALDDYLYGEETWEEAETKILQEAIVLALEKENINNDEIEVLLAGDLLNQIISSNFAARELGFPFLGLYGACSTMGESLILAAMLIDGDYYQCALAAAGSHHYTAQRQFRFPSEQGVQFPPSSQWTATAAGAVVLEKNTIPGIKVTAATIGKVIDMGQDDPNNMGAAMAPAAVDTIKTHFTDLNREPDYYDLIVTGDLGRVGSDIAQELFIKEGIPSIGNYHDCGVLIYNREEPDVNAGASGCGCSAAMLCGPLLRKLYTQEIKKLLFAPTGALMSPTSSFQGETIPGICHAIALEVM